VTAGLTVGDFSRITHLSVKTLRHYHEVGLLAPAGGVFASELFQHERGEATVFVPVEGSVRAIGRVTPVTVPAAELAVISHRDSLSDADLSYATLGSYATRHEISIDGPLGEYYRRGVSDTADEAEWRTEIGWPIFRADGPRGAGG
jgi:effector-binding domain-containing protein